MREKVNELFQSHLPGLRLKALQLAIDAFHAERLVHSVYRHSVRHAAELVAHPDPRSWLLQAMSELVEEGPALAA
jgi:hypothetical protein